MGEVVVRIRFLGEGVECASKGSGWEWFVVEGFVREGVVRKGIVR